MKVIINGNTYDVGSYSSNEQGDINYLRLYIDSSIDFNALADDFNEAESVEFSDLEPEFEHNDYILPFRCTRRFWKKEEKEEIWLDLKAE